MKLNTVHLVWQDQHHYNMVKFQEELKYGQDAGVQLAPLDIVKFAEAAGAKGLRVDDPSQLDRVMDEAFATTGPVVVEIPVDYSHNAELMSQLIDSEL